MMRRAYQKLETGIINAEHLFIEIENYLTAHLSALESQPPEHHPQVILKILKRAADDPEFLARLAEYGSRELNYYELTQEEKAALVCGDIRRLENWVCKLGPHLGTWLRCRLEQERW